MLAKSSSGYITLSWVDADMIFITVYAKYPKYFTHFGSISIFLLQYAVYVAAEPVSGKCCGVCKPIACVEDGNIYKVNI